MKPAGIYLLLQAALGVSAAIWLAGLGVLPQKAEICAIVLVAASFFVDFAKGADRDGILLAASFLVHMSMALLALSGTPGYPFVKIVICWAILVVYIPSVTARTRALERTGNLTGK